MKFERFRNYGFWVSIFSLIGLLLNDFGGIIVFSVIVSQDVMLWATGSGS